MGCSDLGHAMTSKLMAAWNASWDAIRLQKIKVELEVCLFVLLQGQRLLVVYKRQGRWVGSWRLFETSEIQTLGHNVGCFDILTVLCHGRAVLLLFYLVPTYLPVDLQTSVLSSSMILISVFELIFV